MSLDLLGDGFDLHGGAVDLIFPHHENERAQAVAVGRDFARHWVHNGWVTMDGEKMSKSLGNFTSLTDLLERSDPRAYRLLVLRSHYRKPIEVTPDTVVDAEAGLARLDEMARRFGIGDLLASGPVVDPAASPANVSPDDGIEAEAIARFRTRMDDDLDTPGALATVFELVRQANHAGRRRRPGRCARARRPRPPCWRPPWACGSGPGRPPRSTRPPPTGSGGGTRPGPPADGHDADTLRGRAGGVRMAGRGRTRRDPYPPPVNAV